jgi:hypothetical protein
VVEIVLAQMGQKQDPVRALAITTSMLTEDLVASETGGLPPNRRPELTSGPFQAVALVVLLIIILVSGSDTDTESDGTTDFEDPEKV